MNLKGYTEFNMDLDFKDRFKDSYTKILKYGEEYAEAKGQSWQMQELKGSVLSKLIKSQGEIPVSKAEINGKASSEYEQYIQEVAKAITRELSLKAKYEAEKARFEAYRSLSSLEKRTRTLIDGD